LTSVVGRTAQGKGPPAHTTSRIEHAAGRAPSTETETASGDLATASAEGAIRSSLAQISEVQEVHHIAGEDCYLAKIWVRDAKTPEPVEKEEEVLP
jgi:hypothetical protein